MRKLWWHVRRVIVEWGIFGGMEEGTPDYNSERSTTFSHAWRSGDDGGHSGLQF